MRYLPYESLHDLYVNKLWPEKKIAQHFNCSHYIVRRNIAYYGFPSGRLERQNKMTYEELKNYLIKLHQKDGLSVSEIAKQINGSENQIRRYLHKFQVYQKKRTPISKQKLRELYQEKYWSVQNIAKHFNSSIPHIYRMLKKYRIFRKNRAGLRKKLGLTDQQLKETLKQFYQTMTIEQIAEHWDVSAQCIRRHVKRLGIEKVNRLKSEYNSSALVSND